MIDIEALDRKIAERRKDSAFMARIDLALREDREVIERLAGRPPAR